MIALSPIGVYSSPREITHSNSGDAHLIPNDFIAFDYSSYTDGTIFRAPIVDPHHSPDCSNKNFGSAGNFSWKGHRKIQFSAGMEVVFE